MQKRGSFNSVNLLVLLLLLLSLDAFATPVNFSGQVGVIEEDNGAGVYSGAGIGTNFSGSIDDVTANGEISNGTTRTTFGCCIAAGGLSVSNNMALNAEDAALLNTLAGSSRFSAGDLVDSINLEGDASTSGGGRIEIGLSYIFDANTFTDSSRDNYPFDPSDVQLALFFIVEEDDEGDDVFSVLGQLDATPRLDTPTLPRFTETNGQLHIPVVEVPGFGNFDATLELTNTPSIEFVLISASPTSATTDVPAVFSVDTGVLSTPAVTVEFSSGEIRNYSADFALIPGSDPLRFVLTNVIPLN